MQGILPSFWQGLKKGTSNIASRFYQTGAAGTQILGGMLEPLTGTAWRKKNLPGLPLNPANLPIQPVNQVNLPIAQAKQPQIPAGQNMANVARQQVATGAGQQPTINKFVPTPQPAIEKPISFLEKLAGTEYEKNAYQKLQEIMKSEEEKFNIPGLTEARRAAKQEMDISESLIRNEFLPSLQANTTDIANLRNALEQARQSGDWNALGTAASRLNEAIARRINLESMKTAKIDTKKASLTSQFDIADEELNNAYERMQANIELLSSGYDVSRNELIAANKEVEDKLTAAKEAQDAKSEDEYQKMRDFLAVFGKVINPQTKEIVSVPVKSGGKSYQFKTVGNKAYAFDPDTGESTEIAGVGGNQSNIDLLNQAVDPKKGFGSLLSQQNPNVEQLAQLALDAGGDFNGFMAALQATGKIKIKSDGRIVDTRGLNKTIGRVDFENQTVTNE